MYLAQVLTITALLAATVAVSYASPKARLTGGQDVDNLRQFPHHVYILPYKSSHKCGGCILNSQWVLTSAACIKDSLRLELHFGKKNEFDSAAGYYSVSVNSDQVYVYPTNYDDIALVRLPMRLIFSDNIMPVNISNLSIESLRNRFVVMPGFNEADDSGVTTTVKVPANATKNSSNQRQTNDNLKYGMFNVLDNSVCKKTLGNGKFDEYSQLCTEGWGSNPNTPCDSDFGNGLIVGWPAKSELIAMFSMYSPSCDSKSPAVYTYIAKYAPWIESMIQG